jgi:hypothetical protein
MISHNIPISLPVSSLDIGSSAKSLHILPGGFDTLVCSFKILEPQGRSHTENPMTVPNMFQFFTTEAFNIFNSGLMLRCVGPGWATEELGKANSCSNPSAQHGGFSLRRSRHDASYMSMMLSMSYICRCPRFSVGGALTISGFPVLSSPEDAQGKDGCAWVYPAWK